MSLKQDSQFYFIFIFFILTSHLELKNFKKNNNNKNTDKYTAYRKVKKSLKNGQ